MQRHVDAFLLEYKSHSRDTGSSDKGIRRSLTANRVKRFSVNWTGDEGAEEKGRPIRTAKREDEEETISGKKLGCQDPNGMANVGRLTGDRSG